MAVKETTGIRVLFTGQYWPGANSVYIARAFEQCGAIVRWLNDTTIWPGWTGIAGRVVRQLARPLIEAEWNRQLLEIVGSFKPDLVYITNANFCWPKTLEFVRKQKVPLMCFYHDVLWEKRPGSRFSENISYFDLVATTRKWQVAAFRAAGAHDVSIVRFGYDPLVHHPVEVSSMAAERYGAEVTFVGTYETHRAHELSTLVEHDFPYRFRLWGGYWGHLKKDSLLYKYWERRAVHEQEIPVIYAASKVALHWVGWEPHGADITLKMGDQHNSRTFQIAACCGAIMIAQRTSEHLQFFTEDVEAVYFDDIYELQNKLDYWLQPTQDEARRHMAAAGRERCLKEDYSYIPVVQEFLDYFGLPFAAKLAKK